METRIGRPRKQLVRKTRETVEDDRRVEKDCEKPARTADLASTKITRAERETCEIRSELDRLGLAPLDRREAFGSERALRPGEVELPRAGRRRPLAAFLADEAAFGVLAGLWMAAQDQDLEVDPTPCHGDRLPHVFGEPGDSVFEIGDSTRMPDSQWDEEAFKRAMKKRRKELETELAARLAAFLKTRAGKATRKRLDEIDDKHYERAVEIRHEGARRRGALGPNCCGSGEDGAVAEWKVDENAKNDADAERKKRAAIDKGMRGADPGAHRKYKAAQDELDDVIEAQRALRAAKAEAERAAAGDGPVIIGGDGKPIPQDELDDDGPVVPLD